mgnify:CR=1 FL=1
MANYTSYFNLQKDAQSDYYNIDTVNANLDKIDKALGNTASFEKAGGTATAITLTGIEFIDGRSKTFVVSANNNGDTTTINGKPLYKPGTTQAPKLIAGKVVTVWYDASNDCFRAQTLYDADTVGGHIVETDVPADAKFTDTTYSNATQTAAGLMSGDDKKKLDGIESGANKYIHPTGDGNLHVPATGTSNNGKFLKAGSSAGSLSWSNITVNDVSGAAPLASPIFTGTPKAPTGTDYTVSRIRNIRFGTTVPTSLENGEIYFLYE